MSLAPIPQRTTHSVFPATIDETAALTAFAKTLRRRPSSWLGNLRLLRLERVWLPFALVRAGCNSSSVTKRLCCLVDRIEGTVFGLRDDLSEPHLEEVESPLSPRLDLDECRPLAELFLRRRLQVARTERDLEMETSQECFYPFWAAYHEGRRKRIDVSLLDAVTGEVSGTGLRRAFLAGLRAAARGRSSTA